MSIAQVLINPNPNRDEILSLLLGACGENNLIVSELQVNIVIKPGPIEVSYWFLTH